MTWLIVGLSLVLAGTVIAASLPIKIPRRPDREGLQEGDAVAAYDQASRWPIFFPVRQIVLNSLAGHRQQGLLLDAGCGPGYLAAQIGRKYPGLRVIGADISAEMVSTAIKNWPLATHRNVTFLQGDVHRLPFPSNHVDLVVSSLSLHHWRDPGVGFAEIYRVLKPGGVFVVLDLRRDCPRLFYWAFRVGQALLAPPAIRRTNGAVGSIWASYTPIELRGIIAKIPFNGLTVKGRPGWMLARGRKAP